MILSIIIKIIIAVLFFGFIKNRKAALWSIVPTVLIFSFCIKNIFPDSLVPILAFIITIYGIIILSTKIGIYSKSLISYALTCTTAYTIYGIGASLMFPFVSKWMILDIWQILTYVK